jgi:hypothetical protein
MRAILAAVIVAVGLGALGASSALASPANGAAIMKAADETSQVVAVAGGWSRLAPWAARRMPSQLNAITRKRVGP